MKTVNVGVPQGLALEPLLFIIYVNDLKNYVHAETGCQFFDDPTFVVTGNTSNDMDNKFINIKYQASRWFISNKL